MRDVPATIKNAWDQGRFIGDQRAVARVTVQHPTMKLHHYALRSTFRWKQASEIKDIGIDVLIDPSKGERVNQTYANFLFGRGGKGVGKPMELQNVTQVQWNRSIDSDVADCTITAVNSRIIGPDGETIEGQFDTPGYYSYGRGATKFSRSRWGQEKNQFFGMLVPDNIIRTYEGYGSDMSIAPELDPHMVQTGVWIIDDVSFGADGSLSIKCRDIGRILLDQMFYPPLIPRQFYDNQWQNWSGTFTTSEKTKIKLTPETSSNVFWVPSGIIAGHKLSHAFDGNANTFWLSIGNSRPSRRFAYEWVQAKVNNQSVQQVSVRTKKKGYVAYVSVMVGGQWQGSQSINYHEDGIGRNGADIPYVAMTQINTEDTVDIDLGRTYKNVQKIRVTLNNLQNFHFGTFTYRGGIREVSAYGTVTTKEKLTKGPAGSNPGRYNDYTELVKLLCAWGGFFWPKDGYQRICNPPGPGITQSGQIPGYDDTRNVRPAKGDPVLGRGVRGRVWGDFMASGTAGVVPLDISSFDKKPLMDGINYIKDILGFIFFIDELGSVQWRLPNMTNKGNYVSTLSKRPGYRKGVIHFISDTGHILSLNSTLSAANVREAYFVGDTNGKVGSYAPGFNPNPTGLRRYAGWTDVGFAPETDRQGKSSRAQLAAAKAQTDLMAEMLSLRQLFTYRVNKVQIPANPAIQIDDQIRIAERVTSEGYIHYVRGISSSLNNETGEWTYDLDTHWLGFDPASEWLFKPKDVAKPAQAYLNELKAKQLRRKTAQIRATDGG